MIFGFTGGTTGKELACQCRRYKRHGFDPWVGKLPWRRKWLPTPVFFPGKSHGQRSLVSYSPWSRKEMDKFEQLSMHTHKCSGWGRTKILEPACWIQAQVAPFSVCPLICKMRV